MDNFYVTEGVAEYVVSLFPFGFRGVCVDVGAFDPFWISNSWLFEQMGWDTYCIEPNSNCIPRLREFRKNVLEYACSNYIEDDVDLFTFSVPILGDNAEAAGTGLIDHRLNKDSGVFHTTIFSRTSKVKVRTLDWLMTEEIKQDRIDYLSIDVERSEMSVLKGISFDIWKPKVIAIENLEESDDQRRYLKRLGYRRVHRIIYNDFYMRNSHYSAMFGK